MKKLQDTASSLTSINSHHRFVFIATQALITYSTHPERISDRPFPRDEYQRVVLRTLNTESPYDIPLQVVPVVQDLCKLVPQHHDDIMSFSVLSRLRYDIIFVF